MKLEKLSSIDKGKNIFSFTLGLNFTFEYTWFYFSQGTVRRKVRP